MAVSPILTISTLLVISSASESFLKGYPNWHDDDTYPFPCYDGTHFDDFFNTEEGRPSHRHFLNQSGNGLQTEDLVNGVHCRDQYCDSQAVATTTDDTCTFTAHKYDRRSLLSQSNRKGWLGVTRSSERECAQNEWLAGWKCTGAWCSDKMIFCSQRVYNTNHQDAGEACQWDTRTFLWTEWISSDTEPPSVYCPENTFAIGLACRSTRCSELRIKCAEIL